MKPWRYLRFWVITGAAALGLGITASLGLWQLDRAEQKLALQAGIDSQATLPPVSTPDLTGATDPSVLVHRLARLRGEWLAQHTVYLDNRQMQGRPGFFVLTPLRLEGSSSIVVVQRGWVARDFIERTRLPPVPTPPGLVEVEGRIAPWPSQLYAFEGSEQGSIRQNVDRVAWSAQMGIGLLAVSVLQTQDVNDGLSRHWPVAATGVEKHYGYAFQWFGLAVLITALYVWFQFVRRSSPA